MEIKFVSENLIPEKYCNTTFNGFLVSAVRFEKTARFTDEGYISKEISVYLIGQDGSVLAEAEGRNCFSRAPVNAYSYTPADSILCEIQDIPGLNVSK